MDEIVAKELVIQAGLKLIESGLIARTWGNISCRIDDKLFAITPSGRSYETLKSNEIVICRIEDCRYEGEIKPSSEKRIHALVYHTFPDIGFVIHTHQPMASIISAMGIKKIPSIRYSLLKNSVSVADYGLPSTKKLVKGIEKVLNRNKGHALIMAHHGALCFGRDYQEAFLAAQQLEDACQDFINNIYTENCGSISFEEKNLYRNYVDSILGKKSSENPMPLYSSHRVADGFVFKTDVETKFGFCDDMPLEPKIHREIYQNRKDINFISQDFDGGLLAISQAKMSLEPFLDDFAQIIGCSAKCATTMDAKMIEKALRGRFGVLIPGAGALCCAASTSDLLAVKLIMEKNALTQICTKLYKGGKAIPLADCMLMHYIYKKKYSKIAKNSSVPI